VYAAYNLNRHNIETPVHFRFCLLACAVTMALPDSRMVLLVRVAITEQRVQQKLWLPEVVYMAHIVARVNAVLGYSCQILISEKH
jgi:hypothetical protein